jgi:hypothetical protein
LICSCMRLSNAGLPEAKPRKATMIVSVNISSNDRSFNFKKMFHSPCRPSVPRMIPKMFTDERDAC